jgi:hypothetical protein
MIAKGQPIEIAPGAAGLGIVSTTNLPGSISGVAQVRVQATHEGFVEIFPEVEGIAARQPVVIWVAAP